MLLLSCFTFLVLCNLKRERSRKKLVQLIGFEGKSSVFSRVKQMPKRLRALLADQLIILRLPFVRIERPSKRQTIENHSNLSHLVQRSFHRHNYTLFVWQLKQLTEPLRFSPSEEKNGRFKTMTKNQKKKSNRNAPAQGHRIYTVCSEERVKRTRNVFAKIAVPIKLA